jgi:hypothetical protein
MKSKVLEELIFLAGWGHLTLCAGSLMIPRVLKWSFYLKNLQPLLRQMFWTYAAYILVINASFGIISICGSGELLNKSFLAASLTLFISVYWLGRIGIQFFYFDKTDAPKGVIFTLGEVALVGLFIIFAGVYGVAFLFNMQWI